MEPFIEKSPTIYDLARLADASPSTVSAVLNGTWQKRRISSSLADKIHGLAVEHGYTLNMQARALRRERSGIIGMVVPMYDNRYFSSIAQMFETEARKRGLFPIVTCTMRDPELEQIAAAEMLAYRVEYLICTGATDPDRITDLCNAQGIRTVNLDLPGTKATSIISENYGGAHALTKALLQELGAEPHDASSDVLFVGGRPHDHNTKERMRGFLDAHAEAGMHVDTAHLRPCGYAAEKAERSLQEFVETLGHLPRGIFVNSTISLEGIMRWFGRNGMDKLDDVAMGCFDWDPFAALLGRRIVMVRQNVPAMIAKLFELIDGQLPLTHRVYVIPAEILRRDVGPRPGQ